MHRLFCILSLSLFLVACHHTPQFEISGVIEGAENQTLTVEHLGLKQTTMLDSFILKADGNFCFRLTKPQNPDFYRLALGGKKLIIAVDSTETITLHTDAHGLNFASVEGSEQTNEITKLRCSLRDSLLEVHKQYAKRLILNNPLSLAAYYALYQQKNGEYVFNPLLKDDLVCYRAVATAWNMRYPNYERTRSLYNITSEIVKQDKQNRSNTAIRQMIDESENAFLDIENPDENGDICKLSSLRGGWIVLDFSCLNEQGSAAYILRLREIYNKFHSKNLNIFSVSADRSQLLWEESAANLPWTTVWQDMTAKNNALITYNVTELPTLFLFDKSGNVLSRYKDIESLEEDLTKLIK